MKLRKTIIALLLSVFAAQIVLATWLHISYSSNLPKIPDEKSGRIYQIVVNHGSIRYGSDHELQALKTIDNFQPVAILLFLLAVVLGMSWGILKIAKGRQLNE